MSSIYDIIFLIQLIGFLGLFIYKIYNIMNKGEIYTLQTGWLILIISLIIYGIGLTTTILGFNEILFITLFKFESWFLIPFILLTVFEHFFALKTVAEVNKRQRYNAKQLR